MRHPTRRPAPRRLRPAVPAALLAALAWPGAAPAATISYLAQERFVEIEEVPSGAIQRVDAPGFSDFDEALLGTDGTSSVAQSSSLTPTRILAEVSQAAVDERRVASSFSVAFELDEASPFVLEGQIEELRPIFDIQEQFPGFDFQIVLEASLVGPSGVVAAFDFDVQADCVYLEYCDFSTPFEVAGVLDPGTYTLVARTEATLPYMEICFGFSCSQTLEVHSMSDALVRVDLQLVPEPAPAGALVAGLVAFAVAARARRARRRG